MGRFGRQLVAVALLSTAGCATTTGEASKPPTVTVTSLATVTVKAGAGTAAASAATTIDAVKHLDACGLLTLKEANALADLELQPGIGSGKDHDLFTLCMYTRDPYATGTAQVSVGVGDGAKKTLDIDKDVLFHPFTQLQGIGDEAWQEDNAVFLRVGPNWATIQLVRLNDPKDNAKRVLQAATIAAERMR